MTCPTVPICAIRVKGIFFEVDFQQVKRLSGNFYEPKFKIIAIEKIGEMCSGMVLSNRISSLAIYLHEI